MLYRAEGLLDLSRVVSMKIVLVGAGSLGSLIAENLCYPWREFVIIDPDRFGPENVERHLLGPGWCGKPKAAGVAKYMLQRGTTRVLDIFAKAEKALDRHRDANLIIIATGGMDFPSWINQWNSDGLNIPLISGGIYPKGQGGELLVLPNPQLVCLACSEAQYPTDISGGGRTNYGMEQHDQAIPGLRHVVSLIASLAANFALQIVHNGELESQLIRWVDNWGTVTMFSKGGGSIKETLESWSFRSQSMFGSTPSVRAVREDGYTKILAKETVFHLPVKRFARCSFHEEAVS